MLKFTKSKYLLLSLVRATFSVVIKSYVDEHFSFDLKFFDVRGRVKEFG